MGTFVVYRGGSMRTTGEHGAHMILQVAYEDGMRDLHYWSLRRSLNIKTDSVDFRNIQLLSLVGLRLEKYQ